jgi:hypothetical protein
MTNWFHFTCAHAAAQIGTPGVLRPLPQKMFGDLPLIWLTPSRAAQGRWLGMDQGRQHLVSCNRMEVCYQVVPEDEDKVAWWGDLKRDPRFRDLLPAARQLEGYRGAKAGLWGVTSKDLRVVRV